MAASSCVPVPDDTASLALAARGGDPEARERLVLRLAPAVSRLAGRLAGQVPRADLEQAGMIGVLHALEGYQPDRGAFEPYATRYAVGEMLATARQLSSAVHVPRAARVSAREVERAADELTTRQGRTPTVAQVAERTGMNEEEVVIALRARRLAQPPPADEATLEQLADEHDAVARAVRRLDIGMHLEALDERSRRIVALRFGLGLSQTEIAERVGISQMHVSRLLRAALEVLRERLGPDAAA
jgi:RNA polymerase sigma-B factor